MSQQSTYSIIGGDARQIYLLLKLLESGHTCLFYGLPAEQVYRIIPHQLLDSGQHLLREAVSPKEALTGAKCILGSIPLFQNGYLCGTKTLDTAAFIDLMQEGQYLFAGCVDDTVEEMLEQKNISCFDYMKSDEIALFNSIATAEGMLAEAIIHYPRNLHKSRCLVIGYGRCGRTLADKLKGLGADVTVCARRENTLAAAYSMGFDCVHLSHLKEAAADYDLFFNSVPELILTAEILDRLSPRNLIFDLASKPGGVDWQAAKERQLHAGIYLGLPGKYSPASSAEALCSYIIENFNL